MDNAPIVLLCGQAGSGKDTAGKLIKEIMPNTGTLSLASPIKELGSTLFKFTEDQLFGPSESRNAPDPRFDNYSGWDLVWAGQREGIHTDWVKKYFKGQGSDLVGRLERFLQALFRDTYSASKPLTPRLMLQLVGTQFGRTIDPNVWINVGLETCEQKLIAGEYDLMVITDGRFKNEILTAKAENAMAVLVQCPSNQLDGDMFKHASEAELTTVPMFWYDEVIINLKDKGMDHFKGVMQNFCERNFRTVI